MSVIVADERVGTTIAGKYRLERVLGSGGMGVVYAAEHVGLGRPVAVKFLHAHHARDAKVVARFFAEAQAAARLRHPNVVDVLDVGHAEDGSAYMALELLSGEPLSATLERVGRLSPEETCRVILPILEALEIAHERGIVHRDLKPENIFVATMPNGAIVPKVLDFGIAKLLDAGDARATDTGLVVGTPTHLAPERAQGTRDIGGFTDVWSMGVVLYECLAGRHPYDLPESATPPTVMVAIITQKPAPLAKHAPGVSRALAAVVDRALEKDPARRWPSAREMRAALAAAAKNLAASSQGYDDVTMPGPPGALAAARDAVATTTVATAAPSRVRARWAWIAVAVVVAAIGASAAAWAIGGGDRDAEVIATPLAPAPSGATGAPPAPEPAVAEPQPTPEIERAPEPETATPAVRSGARRPRGGARTPQEGGERGRSRAGEVSIDQF